MKIRLKYILLVLLLGVLVVVPTGFALAAPADSTLHSVAAEEDDPDEGEDEDDPDEVENDEDEDNQSDSPYCTGEETTHQHAVAANIAATYQVAYEEVMGYFCEGYGLGEIMLAYETGEFAGTLPADLLDRKGQGNGWGLIWKELGLIGSERDAGAAPGKGRGKPDWAGPPDHANGVPNNPGQGNGNRGDQDECPGNSCNNPGQGNDKENNGNNGNNGNRSDQGNGNGNQDRGDTDDVDEEDSDS